MKKVIAGFAAVGFSALFFLGAAPACSSSFDCSSKACSGDADQTDAQKKACTDAQAGKCSSEFNTYGSCISGKVTCDANNKTDAASALKALADCASEATKYSDCVKANP